jgi:hypothetical protein
MAKNIKPTDVGITGKQLEINFPKEEKKTPEVPVPAPKPLRPNNSSGTFQAFRL